MTSASAVRAALDILVFAPMGLGVKLVDDAPDAVRRARQEISNARFIGRMVVNQGVTQLRERLDGAGAGVAPLPGHAVDVKDRVGRSNSDTDTANGLSADARVESEDDTPAPQPAEAVPVPDVDQLALPDYDHLPAIDIVAKLATMTAAEREAIGRYESANRQRRTVLGKLAQLAGS